MVNHPIAKGTKACCRWFERYTEFQDRAMEHAGYQRNCRDMGSNVDVFVPGTLMKLAGITAKGRRKFKVTTNSKHNLPVAENLLNRQFEVTQPDRGLGFGYNLYLDSSGVDLSCSGS